MDVNEYTYHLANLILNNNSNVNNPRTVSGAIDYINNIMNTSIIDTKIIYLTTGPFIDAPSVYDTTQNWLSDTVTKIFTVIGSNQEIDDYLTEGIEYLCCNKNRESRVVEYPTFVSNTGPLEDICNC